VVLLWLFDEVICLVVSGMSHKIHRSEILRYKKCPLPNIKYSLHRKSFEAQNAKHFLTAMHAVVVEDSVNPAFCCFFLFTLSVHAEQ